MCYSSRPGASLKAEEMERLIDRADSDKLSRLDYKTGAC